jgi:hypothetical protein
MQVRYPLNNPQGEKRTYGKQPPGRRKAHAPGESCTSACELSAGRVHHSGDQGVWRKERVQTGKLFGNRTKILAPVALQRPHRVGKYSVDSAGFEEFLHEVPVFSRGSKLIVMDEIGKMECISPIFRKDHSADPRFRPAVHCHHCEERSALH